MPHPAMPLIDDLLWIYQYPMLFGTNGAIAAGAGVALSYYLYGSPLDADLQALAMGYAVGGVAAFGTLTLLNKMKADAQYQ